MAEPTLSIVIADAVTEREDVKKTVYASLHVFLPVEVPNKTIEVSYENLVLKFGAKETCCFYKGVLSLNHLGSFTKEHFVHNLLDSISQEVIKKAFEKLRQVMGVRSDLFLEIIPTEQKTVTKTFVTKPADLFFEIDNLHLRHKDLCYKNLRVCKGNLTIEFGKRGDPSYCRRRDGQHFLELNEFGWYNDRPQDDSVLYKARKSSGECKFYRYHPIEKLRKDHSDEVIVELLQLLAVKITKAVQDGAKVRKPLPTEPQRWAISELEAIYSE